jgi:hypothetical protein
MLLATHGAAAMRAAEVVRCLDRHRGTLRPLVEARCARDSRLVAATFRLRDGYWLWNVGERRTPGEVREYAHEWHHARYLDGLFDGADPADAETLLWDDDGSEVVRSDQLPSSATLMIDPVEAYRSTALDEVLDLPSGLMATCSKCRQTLMINYVLMNFATGQAIAERARRPVTVLIGLL